MKRTPLKRNTPLSYRPQKAGKLPVYHRLENSLSQLKKRKPMKQRSDKRVKDEKEYTRLRKEFLKEHPLCAVCLWRKNIDLTVRVCKSTEVHHKAGRGKFYLRVGTWLAVCHGDHQSITNHRGWAEGLGFSLTVGQIKSLG